MIKVYKVISTFDPGEYCNPIYDVIAIFSTKLKAERLIEKFNKTSEFVLEAISKKEKFSGDLVGYNVFPNQPKKKLDTSDKKSVNAWNNYNKQTEVCKQKQKDKNEKIAKFVTDLIKENNQNEKLYEVIMENDFINRDNIYNLRLTIEEVELDKVDIIV